VYVLVGLTHNFFLSPTAFNDMVAWLSTKRLHQRASHSDGLSLSLESIKDGEMRSFVLDYAYKPEALLNIGVEPKNLDALIVSHGHFNHYGGLIGFLYKYRSVLSATSNSTRVVRTISAIRRTADLRNPLARLAIAKPALIWLSS
jgi:7,8-dihydropterin-6-yl-methyl-4-(beta-D-ribofuranosyl)aminobenzene 5'-phosphate synthase